MDSSVELDPSVFPFQDIRYTKGKSTGTKPKIKKDSKMAPVFMKPKVPMPGSATVPVCSGVGRSRGGKDKEKPKRRATPSPSPIRGGAVGGDFVDGDSSCVSPNINITERSVVKYTPPVDNKGMYVSLSVVYYLFRW